MIFLGQAISHPEPVAMQQIAERLAALLSELGFSVPVDIVKPAMFSAMVICGDYRTEVEATIEFVGKNLEDHKIIYDYHGK